MTKALLLIDLQNDYFPGGAFSLWNTDAVLEAAEAAIDEAKARGVAIIHVQHIADPEAGMAPFFNEGTNGAQIHKRIRTAAPDAPIVVKHHADSFHQTTLAEELAKVGATELVIAGMMTQNCVTHTAISKAAEAYDVTVLTDCTTTVNEMLHMIALHALSTRVTLATSSEVLGTEPVG